MKKISFSKLNIQNKDINLLNKVLKSGWLADGRYNKKFEEEFCKFTRAKYSVTVSSCTAGLHLSFLALNLKENDEVLVPAMTHTATAHSIEYVGAKPIFCDIDYNTGNISYDQIKKNLTNNTKALVVVHMAGLCVDFENIIKICRHKNIKIIEDCAHALGTNYKNKHVGLIGMCGVFSFYPTKQITTGEGGMIISNNKNFISKLNKLKAFGIDTPPQLRKKPGVYDVKKLGFNYRMTEFQAVLGYTQIKRYKSNLKKRRSNANFFSNLISNLDNVHSYRYDKNNSYFIFQILFKNSTKRNKAIKILKENKIGFSIHYATPVPLFSYYKEKYKYKNHMYPNALAYSNNSLSLPINNNITKKELSIIYEKLSFV